jgi:hypothetical protein
MSTDLGTGTLVNGPADEPVKSGIVTTEFWKAAIVAVIGLLTGLGIIGPNFKSSISESIVDAAALLAAAIASGAYSLARGRVKSAKALGTAAARAGNPLV